MRSRECVHARFTFLAYITPTTKSVQCKDCGVIFTVPVTASSEESPVRLPLSPRQWFEANWYHTGGKEALMRGGIPLLDDSGELRYYTREEIEDIIWQGTSALSVDTGQSQTGKNVQYVDNH